jgi:hypothetical protein
MQIKCTLCTDGIATHDLHGHKVCQECFDLHHWAVGLVNLHWEVKQSGNSIAQVGNVPHSRRRGAVRSITPRIS